MLCHSVRSCRSPDDLSVQLSSVAIEKRQNGVPVPVYFNSGSRPSRPIRITLFIDFMGCVFLSFDDRASAADGLLRKLPTLSTWTARGSLPRFPYISRPLAAMLR